MPRTYRDSAVALASGFTFVASALFPLAAFSAYRLEEVAAGLNSPVFLTAPSTGSEVFVVERAGSVRWFDRQSGTEGTLLQINGKVESASGERGLLGLAFDPEFATNGHFYVNYIDRLTLDTVVERYTAGADRLTADPATARQVMRVSQPPQYSNHKAGWIAFRPGERDNLYIATGDGGGGGDPLNAGQSLNTNLGKILRVDIRRDDASGSPNDHYAIPADNPFAGAVAGNDEIWAFGLRNPYRNSFDRVTGDLWIADVGQSAREEVNFESADSAGGVNYGWKLREGSLPTPGVGQAPLFEYAHDGQSASITGGYVYRGPITGLQGSYFFGDFMRGTIGSFRRDAGGGVVDVRDWTAELAAPAGLGQFEIASFGEDASGNLYVVDYGGRILMLVPEPATWVMLVCGGVLVGATGLRRRRIGGA